MSNVEFSVVIPVRNGANYIRAALESVLSQSYPYFRILVLENGSTDETLEIIRGLASDRITIVPAIVSLSIEQNWGRIIEQPLSEYFTFMGHDDMLHPDFLAEMATLIAVEPGAALYQVQLEEIDAAGNPVRHPPQIAYRETADQYLSAVLEGREEVVGTGYVMRSDDYRQVGGIPAFPGLLYADVVLWYRLTNLSYKVCSPKTLASFRIHPQSMHLKANFLHYYRATLQYYDFLRTSTGLKDSPTATYNEIDKRLQNSYRSAVVQAILSPVEGRTRLQMTKQEVAKDGLFTLHDRAARMYEAIPPLPSWLRDIILLPVVWRRMLRRMLANRK